MISKDGKAIKRGFYQDRRGSVYFFTKQCLDGSWIAETSKGYTLFDINIEGNRVYIYPVDPKQPIERLRERASWLEEKLAEFESEKTASTRQNIGIKERITP